MASENHMEKVFEIEFQSFINLQQTKIRRASDRKQVVESLQDVMARLSLGSGVKEINKLTCKPNSRTKKEIFKSHFAKFADFLLQPLTVEWYDKLSSEERVQYFDALFDEGPTEEIFFVLSSSISRLNRSHHILHVASLLSRFAERNRFVELFFKQTQNLPVSQRSAEKVFHERLITCVISLPDKLANQLKGSTCKQFQHDNYFRFIASQLVLTLEKVHNDLSSTKERSFQFLSDLIGKMAFLGQGSHIFSVLIPAFEKWVNMSPLWKRICSRVVTGIPENGLESTIEQLLKGIEEPLNMGKLLSDKILSHNRLKYLFTTKFILLRYYSQISVPYNLVTYLAGCEHRYLLVETLMTILDVWGEPTAIKHTPYDQHVYITRLIILCFAHLNKEEKLLHKHKLLTKLLTGMQSHLDCPIEKVRHLGMATAECITSGLDSDNSSPLRFDYQKNEEIKLLFVLAEEPSSNQLKEIKKRFQVLFGGSTAITAPSLRQRNQTQKDNVNFATGNDNMENVGECDDDDGLKPYDLTEDDASTTSGKSPKYIRDCIEGLLANDDPTKTEAALNAVENVILSQPDDLEDLAVELAKILIHTEDRYSTKNFSAIRHSALVAITTQCPRQVAEYLTEEIFAPNYSIQQRIDMLDIIATSAQQLAAPVELIKQKTIPSKFQNPKPMRGLATQENSVPNWKAIVQERIENKTRRFAKLKHPGTPAVANKFANVAGNFFFPLLRKFDVSLNTLDLLGKDSFVLARLIHTLSSVMYCARNTVPARTMGLTFIEFLWALRYHNEPYVRQALIFAIAMVTISVPSGLLIEDFRKELFEMHDWLNDIVQSDPNKECRDAALQSLVLFEGMFASGMPSS